MRVLPILGSQKGVQKFWRELQGLGVEKDLENPEKILVLGGDGTFLGGQREYYKRDVPLVGIGFGHENFLLNRDLKLPVQVHRELEKDQWNRITSRGMRAYIDTNAGRKNGVAFNDIYIKSMNPAGMVRLRLNTNEYHDIEVTGDGLIIASPQGSTAYNRNAGGSILPLESNSWAVTGICTKQRLNTVVQQQEIQIEILRGPAVVATDNKLFQNVQKLKIVPSQYFTTILFAPKENFEQRRYRM